MATGAWHRRTDVTAFERSDAAEIKRMYVAPAGRGRGLARAMLAHLESTARAAGADLMILETGTEQPEALALYESSGYRSIPGFGYYRSSPKNRCMALVL
ncbi:ribosomal protein S18 acetylase RimI-like enzyme [Marmoricola sp. OAE513]|uniref:GNAT family N-acetyltransferase n=1 Tax=Marmoricola sp. OAE513 TaxID=2817894 RepID=UPI003393B659